MMHVSIVYAKVQQPNELFMKCVRRINTSVAHHGVADPAVVAADASVHAGVSLHGAVVPPGHDSLQLTAAHQGAAGVSLQTHVQRGDADESMQLKPSLSHDMHSKQIHPKHLYSLVLYIGLIILALKSFMSLSI